MFEKVIKVAGAEKKEQSKSSPPTRPRRTNSDGEIELLEPLLLLARIGRESRILLLCALKSVSVKVDK